LKILLKNSLKNVIASTRELAAPRFWRDDALPFIEARAIHKGRKVSYAKHAHETFSIGIVAAGHCNYLNGKTRELIGPGSVVMMNPGDAHACNAIDDAPWSYCMLYIDVPWLIDIQRDLGVTRDGEFRPFSTTLTTLARMYEGLQRLYLLLIDQQAEHLQKHGAAHAFMAEVHQALGVARDLPLHEHRGLMRAAEFIRENCTRSVKLDEICSAASLSASYLIRAFKDEYGMTPHAYLTNCRIEFCRAQLRRGRPIAEVAAAGGFSDQAHLQRSFKKFVAATPGQYRA
jgi:AraC-like DNA-binding protein